MNLMCYSRGRGLAAITATQCGTGIGTADSNTLYGNGSRYGRPLSPRNPTSYTAPAAPHTASRLHSTAHNDINVPTTTWGTPMHGPWWLGGVWGGTPDVARNSYA